MSNYPVWWDTKLTIFNKSTDALTDVVRWYKHIVDNCFWKYVGDKITINDTVLQTNNIICRIPEDNTFLEKYQWLEIPNDEKENYFTLGASDIIVKGAVNDEIDEYAKGKRSTDLIAKYKELQGCMVIERIAINIGAGRCNPHYLVNGI